MEKMTVEQDKMISTLNTEESIDCYDNKTLRLVAMQVVGQEDLHLFNWIKDIVIELTNMYVGTKQIMKIENRVMYLKYENRTPLRNFMSNIRYRIEEDIYNDISSYKHIENVLPYALEIMFNGETPHDQVTMHKHFQQDNFAYVTYSVRVEKSRGRQNNRRSWYEKVEREVVIERWGDHGENFKTKKSKGKEQFKDLMTQMEAPKAIYINIQKGTRKLEKYDEPTKNVQIIIDVTTKDSTLVVNEEYKFDSNFVLKEVTRPHVVYNNGEAVWFAFIRDSYSDGNLINSNVNLEKFFKINEYGGLLEVPTNPFQYKIIETEEAPTAFTSPKTDDDIYLDVTLDESDIVIPFDYSYISVELTKETYEAREYTIKNKVTEKYRLAYFARYEDKWIHTTKRNHKVKLMFDSYKMIDIMHADEQEGA